MSSKRMLTICANLSERDNCSPLAWELVASAASTLIKVIMRDIAVFTHRNVGCKFLILFQTSIVFYTSSTSSGL